ncbi:MAG: type IX secretion system protein PorQ [Raineya sp.]|jgi:hypothetical protein|nr:type IX secretion system protein PorQ [Raineya sp.]
MFQKIIYIISFLLISFATHAQIGGRRSFEYLNLSANPRTMAVGGVNNTLSHADANMFLNNPALIDSSMAGNATFNFSSFYTGIPHFLLTYGHDFGGSIGTIGMGLQYIRYGNIQETDEAGNVIGEFSAADYAITAGKSFESGNFKFGVNAKLIGSNIASYTAFGFTTDLGGAFVHPTKDLKVGLTINNLGFSFKNYISGDYLKMPFDVRLGVSFKPEHMPLRFSVTAHNLYRWDIAYNDPAFSNTIDPFTGQTQTKKISFTDKLFRHLVFGTELILSKNFHLRFGYNHLRNRELRFTEATRLAGFSGGLAFKVKGWEFAYTRASFNGRARSFIALSKNIQSFFKKSE